MRCVFGAYKVSYESPTYFLTLGCTLFFAALFLSGWQNESAASSGLSGWAEALISWASTSVLLCMVASSTSRVTIEQFSRDAVVLVILVVALYAPSGWDAMMTRTAKAGWTMRVSGPMGHANSWGMVLVSWFSFLLAASMKPKNGSGSLLAGVLVVCTVLAVFQTMSRAAVVVLLGVVCTVLVQYRSQRKWLWGGLGIALVLGAIFINGPGLYARMSSLILPQQEIAHGFWSLSVRGRVAAYAYEAWMAHFWLGCGAGQAVPVIEMLSEQRLHVRPHNTYLLVLMESGVIGLLTLSLVVFRGVQQIWRGRSALSRSPLSSAWIPTLGSFLLFAVFADLVGFPLFWFLLALFVSYATPSDTTST